MTATNDPKATPGGDTGNTRVRGVVVRHQFPPTPYEPKTEGADLAGQDEGLALEERRALGLYTPSDMSAVLTKTRTERKEVVEGLIRERSINLLLGDSTLGKTPLALQFAICVAAGLPVFGRTVKAGRVLYCDGESDMESFFKMKVAISSLLGLDEPPENLYSWSPDWAMPDKRFSSDWTGPGASVLSRVSSVRPCLVIVDPLRVFWPSAEEKNSEVADLIRSLRSCSSTTGCAWLLLHHRRKVSQQFGVPDLVENPSGWFQESSGALGIVNHTDTRLGVIPHPRQGDLLLGGMMRGHGPLAPLDLRRVMDEGGEPKGYELLTGVEHLAPDQQRVYAQLGGRFRFKDVKQQMGGRSDSNAANFLQRCRFLGLIAKDGQDYTKVAVVVERTE